MTCWNRQSHLNRHLLALLALLVAVALVLVPTEARAVPSGSEPVEMEQPDGTSFLVTSGGDAWFSYFTTPEGALVQCDPETTAWHYVIRSDGSLSLGAPVVDGAPIEGACTPDDLVSDDDRRAYQALGGVSWESDGRDALAEPTLLAEPIDQEALPATDDAQQPTSHAQTSAERSIPLLIVVVGFDNISYDANLDWGGHIFGDQGVGAYYQAMSQDRLTFVPAQESFADGVSDIEGDGIVRVTLAERTHGDWYNLVNWSDVTDTQGKDPIDYNEYMLACFAEALAQADDYVRFDAFDSDQDGTLSPDELAVCFVVAGFEGALDYREPSLWAHSWTLDNAALGSVAPTVDGVVTGPYVAVAEWASPQVQEPIGPICHELGHFLGLPDLYPTTQTTGAWSAYQVGGLSLMDAGLWNQDSSGAYVVGALDAWSRYQLGWVEPQEVDVASLTGEGTEFTLGSEADGTWQPLLVRVSDTEYFLIENRQAEGYDAGLARRYGAGSSGVVVWHVDTGIYEAGRETNTVNNAGSRPAVMEVFAEYADDGTLALSSAGGTPTALHALWTRSLWEQRAGAASDRLYLARYDGAVTPSERTYAGVWIQFLSDAAPSMQVRLGTSDANPFDAAGQVDPGGQADPGGKTDPGKNGDQSDTPTPGGTGTDDGSSTDPGGNDGPTSDAVEVTETDAGVRPTTTIPPARSASAAPLAATGDEAFPFAPLACAGVLCLVLATRVAPVLARRRAGASSGRRVPAVRE